MSLEVAFTKNLGGFTLDIAFEAPGGVTALFGRSGAGKTSVINAVAGLLRPDAGRIALDGEVLFDSRAGVDVARHRRHLGYVFQDARLFPHLSVKGNLLFGRRFAGGSDLGLEQVVEMLGIADLLRRRPARLSGGERQRVAIGRALLSGARMLLMDEPLAALDDARKAEILPYLQRLRAETAMPILYVSHALPEVAQLATTLVVLQEGRVVEAGPAAEVLSDPEAVPLIGVRNAGAVLRARVEGHDRAGGLSHLAFSGGGLTVPLVEQPEGAALMLRIEARDVLVARERPEGLGALNILPARVVDIRTGEGPGVAVRLRLGQDLVLARMSRRSAESLALAPGEACYAILKATAIARQDIAPASSEIPLTAAL
ncbi:MAG: molybdenum ABC transporter ATP-binding protein [Pseudomonadota bacterium]